MKTVAKNSIFGTENNSMHQKYQGEVKVKTGYSPVGNQNNDNQTMYTAEFVNDLKN